MYCTPLVYSLYLGTIHLEELRFQLLLDHSPCLYQLLSTCSSESQQTLLGKVCIGVHYCVVYCVWCLVDKSTHTHTHTRAHMHTHTHKHMHVHTHTCSRMHRSHAYILMLWGSAEYSSYPQTLPENVYCLTEYSVIHDKQSTITL